MVTETTEDDINRFDLTVSSIHEPYEDILTNVSVLGRHALDVAVSLHRVYPDCEVVLRRSARVKARIVHVTSEHAVKYANSYRVLALDNGLWKEQPPQDKQLIAVINDYREYYDNLTDDEIDNTRIYTSAGRWD